MVLGNNLKEEYKCRVCGEIDKDKFYPYKKRICKRCFIISRREYHKKYQSEYRKTHHEYRKKQSDYYKKWYANGGRKDLTEFECPKCGETNPERFYRNRKVCKLCQYKLLKIWLKEHPHYYNKKQVESRTKQRQVGLKV